MSSYPLAFWYWDFYCFLRIIRFVINSFYGETRDKEGERWVARIFWRESTLQGEFHLPGGQTLRKGGFHGAECAAKIFQPFLEIFGKFVNKNAIKSVFWGGHGRNISKISKNSHVLRKDTSTDGQKFWDTATKVPRPQPPKTSLVTGPYCRLREGEIPFHIGRKWSKISNFEM